MAVKKSQLFVTALVIALVTAACSGSDSPAAAGPEASPDEEPAVLVEQHPVSPITIDDLGEPDFFDQVDWELTWDDDVVTIRHSDACGDECLTRKTLTVLHRNDGLPEFTSFVVEELRFEGNETSEINAGRLEIEQWSSDGPLAGRFFDQSDRRLMVFHFGSLTTKSKTGQLSNDDLRSALMSNEPLQRIEALRTIIEHPADRSELRDEMINLLDDTNVVPTLFEQQTYGTLRGPWQVVGEHAAIALHRALNWPNPPSFATAGPSQLWIAIDWVQNDSQPKLSERLQQVTDNWRTVSSTNTSATDTPSPLAGVYRYLVEPCDNDLDPTDSTLGGCLAVAHLLCDGTAVWHESLTVVTGSWTIEDDVATLTSDTADRLQLRLGPEYAWPPAPGELTRNEYNGMQCDPT